MFLYDILDWFQIQRRRRRSGDKEQRPVPQVSCKVVMEAFDYIASGSEIKDRPLVLDYQIVPRTSKYYNSVGRWTLNSSEFSVAPPGVTKVDNFIIEIHHQFVPISRNFS